MSGFIQTDPENPQEQKIHRFYGDPFPLLACPDSEKVFP